MRVAALALTRFVGHRQAVPLKRSSVQAVRNAGCFVRGAVTIFATTLAKLQASTSIQYICLWMARLVSCNGPVLGETFSECGCFMC